ncbi:MAG TPA: TorF family putative porin [Roseateles sp.]|uniref:TorF family putative porin n=1 Tax=Roseateles sp. TaxID=1971397 RepID=UPI002EDA4F6F
MPPARPALAARLTTLLLPLLAVCLAARADVGGTLSWQSDARDRGVSYTGGRPGAQLGLGWDGEAGWYAGASLARVRLDADRRSAWLRVYGGRVVELWPGLDVEAGLVVHRFGALSRYDFAEAYVGVLGERWSLRLHHAPDDYGSGQRSHYAEFNSRWPLAPRWAAVGHVGVLRGQGASRWPAQYVGAAHGPTRIEMRGGMSWQPGDSAELQLAWVSASRGGPTMGADTGRRRAVVLGLTAAF